MNKEIKKIASEMKITSVPARDCVFEVIRAAIMRGILPGNMPLRQDEISDALNVSHIPVREAFRKLEAQGLVRIYPNRGAVVTALTKSEIANIMDTLIMLEAGALKLAMANNISEEDIMKAFRMLNKFSTERTTVNYDDLNMELHMSLYRSADNPFLFSLIEQLHANVDRYLHPFYNRGSETSNIVNEHKILIAACKEKDIELALETLETHLRNTKLLLLESPNLNF